MFISLSKKYIFLSNKKAGSTSFQYALAEDCEIASGMGSRMARHPNFGIGGKHLNYQHMQELLEGYSNRISPLNGFFVFGVAREPLSRFRSAYAFRAKPRDAAPKFYTGDISFEDYARRILSGKSRTHEFQSDFFAGDPGPNFVARLDTLEQSIAMIREITGLNFTAVLGETHKNASAPRDTSITDPGLEREIREYLAPDYEFYEGQTNRLRHPVVETPPISIEKSLRFMLSRGFQYELASSMLFKSIVRLQRVEGFGLSDFLGAQPQRIDPPV